MPLRPIASTAAAPIGSASRLPLRRFIVLCLAMAAALHAEPLMAAAAELHLHPAVVASVILSVTALFHWAIISVKFLVAGRRRPAETKPMMVLHAAASAATAATGPASGPQLPEFIVLCFAMGMALDAEALVAAAADLRLHPGVVAFVVFSVATLFLCAILSLNIFVALQAAEREPKMLLLGPPATAAATVASSRHARSAFLILAALMSTSWLVEPFAVAAAELRLPSAAVVVTVVLFAALLNISVHTFGSFFLPRPPPAAGATAARWEKAGAITAAVVGMSVAACLVAAGGSSYVYAPARS